MSDSKHSSSSSTSASAPRSRKASSAELNDEETQSLKLNKSITEMSKNMLTLEKTCKDARDFVETYLTDFDEKVKFKKRKVEELEQDFQLQCKNKELELINSIKESGYNKAVEILATRNPKEVPMQEVVVVGLKDRIAQLEKEMKSTINEEVNKHKLQLDRDYKYNLETSGLKQAAESAKNQAQLEQRDQHIKVLQDSIQSLKNEVNEQRKLTQSISESFSNAQKTTVVSGADGGYNTNNRRG
jgi:hypothetical protein